MPVKKIITIKIPLFLKKILNTLESSGFDGFLVGGSLRDILLHRVPKDWDVATDALPSQIKEIFKRDIVLEIGERYGTIGLYDRQDDRVFEITTFRVDGDYKDSRHPSNVSFTSHIYKDLSRRDFSINALAATLLEMDTGSRRQKDFIGSKEQDSKDSVKSSDFVESTFELLDYFSALNDIKHKRLVCVGRAIDRFSEDALRILRALRFSSTIGFDIESKTKEAIFKKAYLLEKIAKERVQVELEKLILGDYASEVIIFYKDILCVVFKILNNIDESIFIKNCHALRFAKKDIEVRLCVLLNSLKSAGDSIKKLRFARNIVKNVEKILFLNSTEKMPNNKVELKVLLLKHEKYSHCDVVLKWLEMRVALEYTDSKKDCALESKRALDLYNEILNNHECFYVSHLKIKGGEVRDIIKHRGDVMASCFFNGCDKSKAQTQIKKDNLKVIGQILNTLAICVIKGECENKIESLKSKALELTHQVMQE